MADRTAVQIRIRYPLETVEAMEAANPEVMMGIIVPAMKYIKRHLRTVIDGEVMEIDEYASREDYEAFMREAADAIVAYGELLGSPTEFTPYTVLPYASFEGDSWFDGTPIS